MSERAATELVSVSPEGRMRIHLHAGQWRAWQSTKRIILVLAGTQSGKTVLGPQWLLREIQRRGPGDYMVVSPSFPLLSKKALPEFLRLFKRQLGLGEYGGQQKLFTFSEEGQKRIHGAASSVPTQVFMCHAQDPESLESATAKAAWLDEAGQKKFRQGSWEAVRRRLSIHQGRVLITTTPYDLGWLKQRLHDPWAASGKNHPEIDVVHFRSIDNPAFPREEYAAARANMPRWRFSLFYDAIFTRPAGLIYESFDPLKHVVPRFRVPQEWQRFGGLDFGPNNTAAVMLAEELSAARLPTGRLVVYREYHPGKREPGQHARALQEGEPRLPTFCGGSASEDEWREKFAREGLPVQQPPIRDVEVGIDTVYGCFARDELLIMDDLAELLDELESYSREVDEAGLPTARIESKESYHVLDALRYICTWLRRGPALPFDVSAPEEARSMTANVPEGVWLDP